VEVPFLRGLNGVGGGYRGLPIPLGALRECKDREDVEKERGLVVFKSKSGKGEFKLLQLMGKARGFMLKNNVGVK